MKISELENILSEGKRAFGDIEVTIDVMAGVDPIDGVVYDTESKELVICTDKDAFEVFGDKKKTKWDAKKNAVFQTFMTPTRWDATTHDAIDVFEYPTKESLDALGVPYTDPNRGDT